MKCPSCASDLHGVTDSREAFSTDSREAFSTDSREAFSTDSREAFSGQSIRRRRLCAGCGDKFTTYEVEATQLGLRQIGDRVIAGQFDRLFRNFSTLGSADADLVTALARRLAGESA